MAKWSKKEVRRLVLAQTIAFLRHESQVDIDDKEFIDLACKEQERIALKLESQMNRIK